ncbi:hypothetical protein [Marinobacter sp.]|uniref:hypothetical protein n=1 Tax=Marinobacter sp. TaxID=50741 RepID=UPI003A937F71
MANNQKQEVELLIKAGTEGLKSIGQLVKELEALGQDTGEASEQLEGLAGSLKGLRDQQKLVKQFADLKGQTKELAEQQAKTKTNATELGKALAATEKPTKAQRLEFEKARKASKDADQAWQENQVQLNGLRTSLSDAGISTSNLSDEQQRIKREISGVDEEISNVTSELTQMRDSAKEAAKGSKKLGDDVEESGTRVGRFRERLQELNPVLGKIGSGLKTAGIAVAGFVASAGASVATLSIFSKSQAQIADELTNTGNALDVNREQLQLWRIAGDRVGLSGEKVSEIFKRITERLGEFSATGTGEAGNVLKRLNLDIENLINLKPDEQMLAIANAIGEIGSKSEQVALLEKLASDASQLQPLLENNAAGLQAIFEEAQKDGAIYSDAELDKLNKANDVYNAIDLKLKGLTTRIGAELAPAVAQATDKVLDLFNSSGAGDALVNLFTRLSNSTIEFLENISANSGSIGESFKTLTDTLSFFGNTANAVFRGVQGLAAGVLTVIGGGIASLMTTVQALAFALNKIGVVSDSAYGNIAAKAEAARSTVADLAKQTVEYGKKAKDAGAAAIRSFEDTGAAAKSAGDEIKKVATAEDQFWDWVRENAEKSEQAFKKQEDAADRARRGLSDYGVDVKEIMTGVTTKAQEAIDGVGKLAGKIKEAGLTSKQSAKAFKDGFNEAIESVNTKEGLEELRKKIEGLKESGEIGAIGANAALETIREKALELNGINIDVGLKDVERDAKGAKDAVDDLKNSTEEAGEELEEAGRRGATMGDIFGAVITEARVAVTKLSNAARALFNQKTGLGDMEFEAKSASESLREVSQELYEVNQRLQQTGAGDWLNRWIRETKVASLAVQKEFYAQAVNIEKLTEKVEAGAFSMRELDSVSAQASNKFNLLDDQRLNGLQGAIESARQRMLSLGASADSTLNSLRQRLADIRGDTEEAQRLQYEAERARLVSQLELAQKAGASDAVDDYTKALKVLEEIHKTEQRNTREAENEREKEAADRQARQEQAERERQTLATQRTQSATSTQPTVESIKTVNVNLGGQSFQVLASDESALLSALEKARSTAL